MSHDEKMQGGKGDTLHNLSFMIEVSGYAKFEYVLLSHHSNATDVVVYAAFFPNNASQKKVR